MLIAIAIAQVAVFSSLMLQDQVPCTVQDFRGDEKVGWSEPAERPLDIPFTIKWEDTPSETRWFFDRKKDQWGQWWGSVDKEGNVTLNLEFANGHTIDGDHFAAVVSLRDKDGGVIEDVNGQPVFLSLHAGINAKGFCQATGKDYKCYKETKSKSFKVSKEDIENISFAERQHGHYDKIDDSKFWGNVKSLAQCYGFAA